MASLEITPNDALAQQVHARYVEARQTDEITSERRANTYRRAKKVFFWTTALILATAPLSAFIHAVVALPTGAGWLYARNQERVSRDEAVQARADVQRMLRRTPAAQ